MLLLLVSSSLGCGIGMYAAGWWLATLCQAPVVMQPAYASTGRGVRCANHDMPR